MREILVEPEDVNAVENPRVVELQRLGLSPGFRNMRWSKPVYAGDTVSFRSVVTDLRPSKSRPGWGLASHRNSGANQHGEEVFSFEGTVFWERRGAEA